jgi:phospholipase C
MLVGSFTPASGRTSSVTMRPAAASPIKHVVLIYQENHSFDNVLGDLCVADHRCDGSIAPVRLKSGAVITPKVSPDIVPDVDHRIVSQVAAIDNGAMDGWASVGGCQVGASYPCITYYQPAQIPALAALARQFTISDHSFQSSDAPSYGAHLELAAGTLDGFTGDNPSIAPRPPVKVGPGFGCDSNREAPWVSPSTGTVLDEPSCIPDPALHKPNGGAYEPTTVNYTPTIMDRLDAAALSWRIYANPPSPTALLNNYIWALCPTFAECLYTQQKNNMVPYGNIVNDAAAGHLPALALLMGANDNAQHNENSMIRGDNWIGQVVSAIEHGPDWSSTAIFITYDDCGCFYDHVPPPTREGIRAPMVIVSPYARPGFTDSTPANVIGSTLAFIEHTFNLPPLTALDGKAYDYATSFNYTQTPLRPDTLPSATPISEGEQQQLARMAPQIIGDPT